MGHSLGIPRRKEWFGGRAMTEIQGEVTNQLTGERIAIRTFVAELVGSTRLDVLRSLEEDRMSPADFEAREQMSRQTASKHLNRFQELGLTKSVAGRDGYELTAGGQVLLDAFEDCIAIVDRDSLHHLGESSHALPLLTRVSTGAVRPLELVGSDPTAPSRATVQRELQRFVSENWSRQPHDRYELTEHGRRVLEAFDSLATETQQVMEKAQWFQRLDQAWADVPVDALEEATLYASSAETPGVFIAAALDLCDPDLEGFRVLTPIFNPRLFRAYERLYEAGLEGEMIVDATVYDRLRSDGLEHFLDDSDYPNFDFYRLEESVSIGVAIYDGETVGPSDPYRRDHLDAQPGLGAGRRGRARQRLEKDDRTALRQSRPRGAAPSNARADGRSAPVTGRKHRLRQ